MFGKIASLFSGGLVNSIEKVALEYIETDKESAEAKALLVKTLDPNGIMRRELASFASKMYGFYLIVTSILAFLIAFEVGDVEGAKLASKMMSEQFVTITLSWAGIVSASFGVNAMNVHKGK